MPNWRDSVLQSFTPEVARLTVCADPDGILAEESLLAEIMARGFELLIFTEPVSFRFAYESRYRTRWDNGEQSDLVVIVSGTREELQRLPYDMVQIGRVCSFALSDLFPRLNNAVLCELDRSDLDVLYQSQLQPGNARLGEDATRDFVLQHVFGVVPSLIKKPVDLLQILLRLHYGNRQFPPLLEQYLIQVLRVQKQFIDWPLERIIPDRTALFAFLQERWPIYLDDLAHSMGGPVLRDSGVSYQLSHTGPGTLPFEHADIRVYVDTLFLDGLLHPVSHPAVDQLSQQWVTVGITSNPETDRAYRLERLIDTIEHSVPAEDARHRDWLSFAYRWAELSVLWHNAGGAHEQILIDRYRVLCSRIDQSFLEWIERRYAGLANQPPVPPVMVHHIPRVLARSHEQAPNQRLALVVLDGLALDQWVILREVLSQQIPGHRFQEDAVFAWLPTITSVSRQAIFAGKPPFYFASSITTTSKEKSLWVQYWSDLQIPASEVAYQKSLGAPESLDIVREELRNPKTRIFGLVVDTVDRIMHGMQLGSAGMHNQVRQWAESGWLAQMLTLLLDSGFSVFITADHGNVEATGCGNPNEGMVADLRGGRVRVYTDQTLRTTVRNRFPAAIAWEPIGLPPDYYALFAPARSAFASVGERIIAHGGPSLEEVIVPFVQIVRAPA